MAKVWESKLQNVLKYSEKELGKNNPKRLDKLREWTDATAQLHKTLQQVLPQIQKYDTELGNLLESLGRIAAELSVYEEDLEAAKTDKAKKTNLEQKMKPLIKSFEKQEKQTKDLVKSFGQDVKTTNEKVSATAQILTAS